MLQADAMPPDEARRVARLKGCPKPRVAPPTPARSQVSEFTACAKEVGIDLFPWQRTAARYLTALGVGGTWLYREVALVVARQNGKSRMLVPLVVKRLREGQRIMHTAQNRDLPREVFNEVADIMQDKYGGELRTTPRSNGIRLANGQEEIRTRNGGSYRIVAPTRGGARGPTNDLVIVDELREMVDWSFINAAKPTMITRQWGQIVYLSNAGTESSVVLNTLRKRADLDPSLAYLEWSAAPNRKPDDLEGWLESNPSIGHMPQVLSNLESEYQSNKIGETLANFETEHLCRWVITLAPALVDIAAWENSKAPVGEPVRPVMGISLDPSGTRASAVIAWQENGGVSLRVLADVTGDPIDLDRFGPELKALAARLRVSRVIYSPYDADLARFWVMPKPIRMDTLAYANASAAFVRLIEGGQLHWQDAEAISGDLPWTTRHTVGPGGFVAVKSKEDRPITAVRAAIEAVGVASAPQPGPPRIM
jgi:hypothetical protein